MFCSGTKGIKERVGVDHQGYPICYQCGFAMPGERPPLGHSNIDSDLSRIWTVKSDPMETLSPTNSFLPV